MLSLTEQHWNLRLTHAPSAIQDYLSNRPGLGPCGSGFGYATEYQEPIHFCRPVAVYIRILLVIITRDLPQFILVMIVVLLSFGGGLYFALRGEPNVTGSGDFNPVHDTNLGLFPDDTR